jgi:hypothetical protein
LIVLVESLLVETLERLGQAPHLDLAKAAALEQLPRQFQRREERLALDDGDTEVQ